MKYTTKAQTEIFGLILIVVLIVAGIMFMAYNAGRQITDSKQEPVDSQLSQTMISAMLQSTTDCGMDLKEIVEDCFGKNDICEGRISCEYASEKIAEIFEGSLKNWGNPYYFYAEKDGEIMIEVSSEGCGKFSEKASSGLLFLPSGESVVVATLDICKI